MQHNYVSLTGYAQGLGSCAPYIFNMYSIAIVIACRDYAQTQPNNLTQMIR
jgi:hypothetical protein